MARIKYRKGRSYYVALLLFLLPAGFGVWLYVQWREQQTLRNSAAAFLELAQQGRIRNAYESTAAPFQAATSEAQLRAFFQITFPGGVRNWLWTSAHESPRGRLLEGKIWSGEGEVVPVGLTLTREDKRWKVISLDTPAAGLLDPARRSGLPGDKEIASLVAASFAALGDAQASRDFAPFHQRLALVWQQQTTPAMLAVRFKPLAENQVDLATVKSLKPVISRPPALDANQELVVEGYYLPPAGRLNFTLRYTYEHPEWRLAGVSLNNQP